MAPRVISTNLQQLTLEITSGIELINGEVTSEGYLSQINICPHDQCTPPELPEIMWGGKQRGCWVNPDDIGVTEGNDDQGPTEEITEDQNFQETSHQSGDPTLSPPTERESRATDSTGSGCYQHHSSSPLNLLMIWLIGYCLTQRESYTLHDT